MHHEGRVGKGKECDAPTHLIKNSKLSHAGCITENTTGHGHGFLVPNHGRTVIRQRLGFAHTHYPYPEASGLFLVTRPAWESFKF